VTRSELVQCVFTQASDDAVRTTAVSVTVEVQVPRVIAFTQPEIEEVEVAAKEKKTPEFKPPVDENAKVLSAEIEGVDQLGRMVILFSEQLNATMMEASSVNTTALQIYLVPYEDWHLQQGNFSTEQLNLTWACTAVTNTTSHPSVTQMDIQIDFNSPLYVSPKRKKDQLVVRFKNDLN
jgi:hypothetical protein